MTREQKQANRLNALSMLDKVIKSAYSGLTCHEYEAIQTAYRFIKMCYERDSKI